MLAGVLKALAPQYGRDRIVVLSPWGARSTAARTVSGAFEDPAQNADLRWLRANLGEGVGRVTYGSIPKLKGIEADAVVINDVGQEAQTWAAEHDLDWDDLLYVALSRAKYRAVVIETPLLEDDDGKDRAAPMPSQPFSGTRARRVPRLPGDLGG